MPKMIYTASDKASDYDKAIGAASEMMLGNLKASVRAGIPVEVLVPAVLAAVTQIAAKSEYAAQTPTMLRMYADLMESGRADAAGHA